MLRAPISQAGSTRRGMVTAQVVLSLSALMAMLAVVADGGLLLVERRHAQATADAAALAAASVLEPGGSTGTNASASAMAVASPTAAPTTARLRSHGQHVPRQLFRRTQCRHAYSTGYAEAIVTWYQQRFFSGIFGSGAIPVSARAVAGVVRILFRRPRGVSRVSRPRSDESRPR